MRDRGLIIKYLTKIGLCGWLIAFSTAWAQLEIEWVETYGGDLNDVIYDHIETEDGGFAFTGGSNSNGDSGVWLGKVNQNGELQWEHRLFGEDLGSLGYSLFEQDDGGFLIFGYMRFFDEERTRLDKILVTKTTAEGDSILWRKFFGGEGWERAYKAVRTNDGGFALAGVTTSWGAGREDFFLLKLDENCDSLWMQTYGDSGVDICNDLIQTSDGGYALVGSTTMIRNSPTAYWALFVDENGDSLRSMVEGYGGTSNAASTIQEVEDGNFIVSGIVSNARNFPNTSRIWTININANGRRRWERIDGGDNQQSQMGCFSSCILSDTSIAMTGLHGLNAEFGEPEGKLWILEVTADGEGRYIIDEGWDELTSGSSIILTTNNELSVAGNVGNAGRDTWIDGQIYKTSELPNRVRSGFDGGVNRHLLLSAYPNPFNGVSTFAFSLRQPSTVMIDIFNTLGRKQVVLVSGNYSTGLHRVEWDGSGLPSGKYLIQMIAGGQVSTRKVTLLQ